MDQEAFAEANHSVILRFLRNKRLPFDDYYDVVVFGYLRAVRQYCSRPELRAKYDFNAMAWRKMQDDLANHFKAQSRPSRKAVTVSLEELLLGSDRFTLAETIPYAGSHDDLVEAEMLCEQILGILTDEQAETLRLRLGGYNDREIAGRQKCRVRDVNSVFADIQAAVLGLCLV
jgi:RNA polymerase sigma-70 factor (ECF subfamily)